MIRKLAAVEVTSQSQLDELPADAIAVVRSGYWWAYGSATVEAYGSATVWAYDAATVRAYGSATVEAYGSATVWAYDAATVRASKSVAIHKHLSPYGTPSITGGVVIEVPDLHNCDAPIWADYYDVTDQPGTAIVFVALDDNWQKGHRYTVTTYQPGTTVEAVDWQPTRSCGRGLHAAPSPSQARRYNSSATRYAAVRINLAEAVPLGDRIKFKRCEVLHEVDIDGVRVDAAVVA